MTNEFKTTVISAQLPPPKRHNDFCFVKCVWLLVPGNIHQAEHVDFDLPVAGN